MRYRSPAPPLKADAKMLKVTIVYLAPGKTAAQ
jgi:hypothetical protein